MMFLKVLRRRGLRAAYRQWKFGRALDRIRAELPASWPGRGLSHPPVQPFGYPTPALDQVTVHARTTTGAHPPLGDEFAAPGAPFATPCPRARYHTPAPEGYLAWHAWAERKSRRHYQLRCSGCGLLAIWRRKPRGMA